MALILFEGRGSIMRNKVLIVMVFCIAVQLPLNAMAALQVFACEPEWAALAEELGGDQVKVSVATNALQDPHYLEARPSLISRMRRADLLICTGAQLEIGWLPMLLTKANNPGVRPGNPGYFEAADFVRHLEVPASVDRSQGDVHPQGNPHIQTDPRNILLVAIALSDRLASLDPDHAGDYQSRLEQFLIDWNAALVTWEAEARPLQGKRVVTHHKSWVYLESWLGLELVGTLEPVPGIPPTASHLSKLLAQLGDDGSGADFIIRSPFQSDKASEWLSERTSIPELVLPFTVGGNEEAGDLYGLFSDTIKRLLEVSK
jgi:zinc/manganese transport system substrate-binding protein